ncbi:NUDIX hydrolase [Magnetococcus sp. PR-3]|uniref:NUDIX hydrolase n=1 Tax=Magnetococcus sp. PR-3 TaxID=3120355 RepID=UPI002FCDFAAC
MNKPPPFQCTARRSVFENSRFNIHADTLVQEDGYRVNDYLVVEPQQSNAEGLTGVMILPEAEGKFFLLRIYRHPIKKWGWELPGGFMENEALHLAAHRELREETGLECHPKDLINLGETAPCPGVVNGRIAMFVAKNCTHVGPPTDTQEPGLGQGKWMDQKELVGLMARPDGIQDAVTMMMILLYLQKEAA